MLDQMFMNLAQIYPTFAYYRESEISKIRKELEKVKKQLKDEKTDAEFYLVAGKQLEKELKQEMVLRQQLMAKNAELENLAHTISHGLKLPLGYTSEYLGILKEDDLIKEDGREMVSSAIDNLDQATEFISKLLELAKAGQVIGEKTEIKAGEFIIKVLTDMPQDIKRHLTMPERMHDLTLMVDLLGFKQIWQNLFSNAINHKDSKEDLTINVDYEETDDSHQFYVKDNGIGIQKKNLGKIFNFGFTTRKKEGGTGFGLAITKKIIEAHGGEIWVTSEGEGKGATFYFTIPKK